MSDKIGMAATTQIELPFVLRWRARFCGCNNSGSMRMAGIALVLFVLGGAHSAELLNGDLYLSSSRCVRPLPCGFTGHVARPARSIRNVVLRNVAMGINR